MGFRKKKKEQYVPIQSEIPNLNLGFIIGKKP